MSTSVLTHRRMWTALVAALALALGGVLAVTARPSGATGNVQTVVNSAYSYAKARGERSAVAVYDRTSNQVTTAGDAGSYYATASLVKVFIAARLLETGQMTGSVEATAYKMITQSDDASANALYGRVGGDNLYQWVNARFHIPIAPPNDPGTWGETRVTALGMISFYRQVLSSPKLATWLPNAMAHYTCPASDGWPQCMGIPSVNRDVAVKQGWMCCLENLTRMHTTGYLDDERTIVVILTEGSTSVYGAYGRDTLTGMAQRVLPGGHLPAAIATMTPGPHAPWTMTADPPKPSYTEPAAPATARPQQRTANTGGPSTSRPATTAPVHPASSSPSSSPPASSPTSSSPTSSPPSPSVPSAPASSPTG